MSTISFASTMHCDVNRAARELKESFVSGDYSLIAVFYSSSYNPDLLRSALLLEFPNTTIVGCSTAGEIGGFGYSQNSISAVAFAESFFEVSTQSYANLSDLSIKDWHESTLRFHREHNIKYRIDSDEQTFAFLLIDGFSRKEEPFTRVVCNAITGIPVVGGSAGDGLNFNACTVLHNDFMMTDSAVLVFVTTPLPFRLYKTQNIVASESRMVVTGAIPDKRIITEINGYPAAEEYARMCHLSSVDELTPATFAANPVVVVMGDEQYVRSIQRINPDMSMTFYCAIDQGMVMRKGRCSDLVCSMEDTLNKLEGAIGSLEGMVVFDCILRRLQLERSNEISQMGDVLKSHNALGFSTYGEQYSGLHVNQTCTGIAIGSQNED